MDTQIFAFRKKSKKRLLCCVYNCESRLQKDLNVVFHAFPKANGGYVNITNAFGQVEKVDRLKVWKKVLRIEGKIPIDAKVCSKHFKKEDYILPYAPSLRRRLKKNAFPSCNLPTSSVNIRSANKQSQVARDLRVINRNQRKNDPPVNKKKETILGVKLEPSTFANVETDTCDETNVTEIAKVNLEEKLLMKSCQEIGIQVNSDFLSFNLVNMIINDAQLSTVTGIETIKILNNIVKAVEIALDRKSAKSSVQMTLRDNIIMTYVKLKQNMSFSFLALLFQCTTKHCTNIFCEMITILSTCLNIAIPWPSKEEVLKNMPICFETFRDVRVVIDCTEIFIQSPSKILSYSQYKSSHTCKVMTGVTPAGNISFVSKYYGERASDNKIFCQSNIFSRLEPGDAVMVDEGFRVDEICARHSIKCIRPPFLKEKMQFSKEEAQITALIAKARVHVERSNQRINSFLITGARMPAHLIPYVGDIFNVICGTVNLSLPIMEDEKFLSVK